MLLEKFCGLPPFLLLSRCMTKPANWPVRLVKTKTSLGIHPVWSESSLSALRKVGSLATHIAHSRDLSDRTNAQADLSLRWEHRSFCQFCCALAYLKNQQSKGDNFVHSFDHQIILHSSTLFFNNSVCHIIIWATSQENMSSRFETRLHHL